MFTLEDGDTGEALLLSSTAVEVDKVNGVSADRDRSEPPPIHPDARVKLLIGLSRWERAGMLAWIAASKPDVFDDAAKALGYT